ncbi:unnamed protein product [Adineta steineri]|uniref:Uncharacterized protein n=1 Tax=Adineta steineri TaxID=433720 RepID=A0A815LWH8_9BILA|nr:unnamed protein product [Adineta steineri]CAF3534928.1 unnamed protein product [Adineta steineri]
MFLRFFVIFPFFLLVNLTPLRDERRQTIERVRLYLRQFDVSTRAFSTTPALENSNKIGFGFDLLSGAPICYTGECRTAGFTRSIFKLNYTSPVLGSCTDKLVPDNVDLECVPETSLAVDSEIIDTIEHLHKSISNKVEASIGAQFKGLGFSYQFSKETRYMLDNIVKNHQTSIFTKVQISSVRLSMFEPRMELSDNFKYVIENFPCCEEDDPDIEEYARDFIFDYFGFTYASSILLGGIAQQTILINRETKERLEKQGVDVKHEASLAFITPKVSAGTSTSYLESKEGSKYENFSKEIQSIRSTSLGGDPVLANLTEWSKSVTKNPVVIEFTLRDIFRLLKKNYFPNDFLITNKSKLIEKALEKYIGNSMFCYNNCGGNGTRGTCEPSGYFQFGICKCKPGWTGPDCGTILIEPPQILHGTICGLSRSFMKVNCGGLDPWKSCPTGWSSYSWKTDLTVCFKNQTEISSPVHGTLCGLYSYHSAPFRFEHSVGCNITTNGLSATCPLGYQYYQDQSKSAVNAMCAVVNAEKDLPGTLCGMQIGGTISGPSCNGYDPGLSKCPPKYTLKITAFNDLGFYFCLKI